MDIYCNILLLLNFVFINHHLANLIFSNQIFIVGLIKIQLILNFILFLNHGILYFNSSIFLLKVLYHLNQKIQYMLKMKLKIFNLLINFNFLF